MPINNVIQPEEIEVSETIRIKKAKENEWFKAVEWYEDKEIMYYSEGDSEKIYNLEDIKRMYSYLSKIGELYFIEVYSENTWRTIGDVTLAENNLPIVIGDKNYWGKSIGKMVIEKLLIRAKEIGIKKITVPEIYHYNNRSSNLFQSLGFKRIKGNDKSATYEKILIDN